MSEEAQQIEQEQPPAVDMSADVDTADQDSAGEIQQGDGDAASDHDRTHDDQQAASPSGGDDEISKIRAEMEALRKEAQDAKAESNAVRNVYDQALSHQDRMRQQRDQEEALAAMTPTERVAYEAEIRTQEMQGMHEEMKAELADANDKADFQRLALDNPVARKHADEVEKRLQNAHNAGFKHVKRTTILKDLLGEKLLEGALNGTVKQAEQGQQNVQKSTTQPSSNAGDQATNNDDRKAAGDREARNERLRNRHTAYK